jgi:hypothetical protein
MVRYFVAGNAWLFLAVLLVVGAGYAGNHGAPYYSFLGGGQTPWALYVAVVLAVLGIAAWHFVLYALTRPSSAEPRARTDRPRD